MESVKIHGVYKHYKGNLYIVEAIALNTETEEDMVIYRALYDDNRLFARPLAMFIEELELDKQNTFNQKHRFELQNISKK